jgi:hypothetical protein
MQRCSDVRSAYTGKEQEQIQTLIEDKCTGGVSAIFDGSNWTPIKGVKSASTPKSTSTISDVLTPTKKIAQSCIDRTF